MKERQYAVHEALGRAVAEARETHERMKASGKEGRVWIWIWCCVCVCP